MEEGDAPDLRAEDRADLERATDRIVEAVKPVAALAPPPFLPLSDARWARIEEMVEGTRGRCGGTRVDLRGVVDGIRWVLHCGAKWREVPPEFGAATTCWRWYERWSGSGVWPKIVAMLGSVDIEPAPAPARRPTKRPRDERSAPRIIEVQPGGVARTPGPLVCAAPGRSDASAGPTSSTTRTPSSASRVVIGLIGPVGSNLLRPEGRSVSSSALLPWRSQTTCAVLARVADERADPRLGRTCAVARDNDRRQVHG